jgi:uncharacterized protein (DUF2147 family)
MKTLIAAALLLAATSPAFASDDDANRSWWDCPHGVKVTMQDDGRTFDADPPTKKKITKVWNFEAPGPDFEVWLGNKICKYRFKSGS